MTAATARVAVNRITAVHLMAVIAPAGMPFEPGFRGGAGAGAGPDRDRSSAACVSEPNASSPSAGSTAAAAAWLPMFDARCMDGHRRAILRIATGRLLLSRLRLS